MTIVHAKDDTFDAAVLQSEKRGVGIVRGRDLLALGSRDTEYAAFLVEVAVIAGSRSRLIKIRARHRFTGHRDPADAS